MFEGSLLVAGLCEYAICHVGLVLGYGMVFECPGQSIVGDRGDLVAETKCAE